MTLFEYPPAGVTAKSFHNRIIYTKHDHKQLQPPKFLNDTIISFFMQYHLDLHVEPELKNRIHIFNSFFFAKIKAIRQNKNSPVPSYGLASRWLRGVKIFDKDFLIMPVCERDHWLLVIVCYPSRAPQIGSHRIADEDLFEPAVIVLNSCKGLAPAIKKALSQFLKYQWRQERGTDQTFNISNAKKTGIRIIFPELPQQKNNYDCGVYILCYFYSFLSDPRGSYLKMFRRQNMKSWFADNDIDITRERRKMATVIKNQITTWASTREPTIASSRHEANSQEIHIDSPNSQSDSSNGDADKAIDINGNDNSVIVIH